MAAKRDRTLVDREAVERMAYALYVGRGCEDGYDVEDWLRAQALLLEEAAKGAIAEVGGGTERKVGRAASRTAPKP